MHSVYVTSRKQGNFQLAKVVICAVDIEKGNSWKVNTGV